MGEHERFSGASSSLGYFYQCRYALLGALRRLREGDHITISIETLDDVAFDTDGGAVEILQTKHHITTHANLTDASPDLWKTLRIWVEGQSEGIIPQDAHFYLITTAVCGDGTAAAYLRAESRDEVRALHRLDTTASTSTNRTNSAAYLVFGSLSARERAQLVKSITILDGSPSIAELDIQLREAVFFAAERKFLKAYLQRLEGWWFGRVVKHLQIGFRGPILGEELEAETRPHSGTVQRG